MISAEELAARMRCDKVPAENADGTPIPKLDGCFLKPLDCDDMLAVSGYIDKHGATASHRMMFVRAVVNEDGSRIFSDEWADKIGGLMGGSIGEAVHRIRLISGQILDTGEDEDGQKKTTLRNGKT